jgi:hypothetical protein
MLCVALAGCSASTPHASPAVLAKALRSPFQDFARGGSRRFCADFTAPAARQIAAELGPSGHGDCTSSLARYLTSARDDRTAAQLASVFTVAAVRQHGVRAVARISDGKEIRFEFSAGRWRIAQVPRIEGSYLQSNSGRPAYSGVFSFSF